MGIPEIESFITVDEYIEGELQSEVRHEYIGGQVYAMSGGSEAHNAICLNMASALARFYRTPVVGWTAAPVTFEVTKRRI